jgi:putative membrane protein
MTLTDADRARLNAAVHTAESHTSAEIVVVIRAQSGAYADVTLVGAALCGLLTLFAALFVDFELDPLAVVPAVLVAALLGAGVSWKLGPRFVSSKRKQAQVDEAALASFARCGVHRTTGRTGLLVYLSTAERLARLLPDQGVIDAVPTEVRGEWRAALAALAVHPTVEALALQLEALGERAGRFLPHAPDDVDELQGLPGAQSAVELA